MVAPQVDAVQEPYSKHVLAGVVEQIQVEVVLHVGSIQHLCSSMQSAAPGLAAGCNACMILLLLFTHAPDLPVLHPCMQIVLSGLHAAEARREAVHTLKGRELILREGAFGVAGGGGPRGCRG